MAQHAVRLADDHCWKGGTTDSLDHAPGGAFDHAPLILAAGHGPILIYCSLLISKLLMQCQLKSETCRKAEAKHAWIDLLLRQKL